MRTHIVRHVAPNEPPGPADPAPSREPETLAPSARDQPKEELVVKEEELGHEPEYNQEPPFWPAEGDECVQEQQPWREDKGVQQRWRMVMLLDFVQPRQRSGWHHEQAARKHGSTYQQPTRAGIGCRQREGQIRLGTEGERRQPWKYRRGHQQR